MQPQSREEHRHDFFSHCCQRKLRIVWGQIFAVLFCIISGMFPHAYAKDYIEDDGNNGVLRVHGTLTESACRLEMTSVWQDINLGNIDTAHLAHIGAQGFPIVVQLHLHDCQRTGGQRDERTGNLVWAAYQPTVSVSFTAQADMDNPQLIHVNGSSGLALRLTDAHGRDVRLGSRGIPLLLVPGQDALIYHVIPERTRAPLRAGAYSALVNFRLNYE